MCCGAGVLISKASTEIAASLNPLMLRTSKGPTTRTKTRMISNDSTSPPRICLLRAVRSCTLKPTTGALPFVACINFWIHVVRTISASNSHHDSRFDSTKKQASRLQLQHHKIRHIPHNQHRRSEVLFQTVSKSKINLPFLCTGSSTAFQSGRMSFRKADCADW